MKNNVNPIKCFNKTVTKTFSDKGILTVETTSETYSESESVKSNPFHEPPNNSKWHSWFNKPINFILKAEGLISFCYYFKEPSFINFLIFIVIGIGKLLMFN